jgi:hypothetical protein
MIGDPSSLLIPEDNNSEREGYAGKKERSRAFFSVDTDK